MKKEFFKLTGHILCLAGGVFISLIELQLFSDSGYTSILFPIILIATVILVFVYFTAGNSAIFLMVYTIIFAFLLSVLKKEVDVRFFLAGLLCLLLLYAQSHFQANSVRFCTQNPAFGSYFLILLICFGLVVGSTFLIYHKVLVPNLPESERFAIFRQDEELPPPDIEQQAMAPYENIDGGGQNNERAIPWGIIAKAACFTAAGIVCIFILFCAVQYIRYRLWRKQTLSAPPKQQISRIYHYIICALDAYGLPKPVGETPFEYLKVAAKEHFPLPKEEFALTSQVFVASQLGGKEISLSEKEICISLLRSISPQFRKRLGIRGYIFRYLPKMHLKL